MRDQSPMDRPVGVFVSPPITPDTNLANGGGEVGKIESPSEIITEEIALWVDTQLWELQKELLEKLKEWGQPLGVIFDTVSRMNGSSGRTYTVQVVLNDTRPSIPGKDFMHHDSRYEDEGLATVWVVNNPNNENLPLEIEMCVWGRGFYTSAKRIKPYTYSVDYCVKNVEQAKIFAREAKDPTTTSTEMADAEKQVVWEFYTTDNVKVATDDLRRLLRRRVCEMLGLDEDTIDRIDSREVSLFTKNDYLTDYQVQRFIGKIENPEVWLEKMKTELGQEVNNWHEAFMANHDRLFKLLFGDFTIRDLLPPASETS